MMTQICSYTPCAWQPPPPLKLVQTGKLLLKYKAGAMILSLGSLDLDLNLNISFNLTKTLKASTACSTQNVAGTLAHAGRNCQAQVQSQIQVPNP